MSSEALPNPSLAHQDFARLWGECTARALGQLQGATFTPAPQAPQPVPPPSPPEPATPPTPPAASSAEAAGASTAEPAATSSAETPVAAPAEPVAPAPATSAASAPAEPLAATASDDLSLIFKVSGLLAGEQLFRLSKSDGLRLAQMLMAEPLDAAADFSEAYADALNEIFRQFAGLASSACNASYGGEVQFQLEPAKTPEWKAASAATWSFTAPQVAPIHWTLLLSPELSTSVEAAHESKASPSPAPRAAEPSPQTGETAPQAVELAPTVALSGASTPPTDVPPDSTAAPSAPATTPIPKDLLFVPPPAPTTPPTSKDLASPSSAAVAGEGNASNLDLLLDVVLDATLRFGEKEMLLRDILELHPGSVVELNRLIQEPAELLVAGRVIAHGEVVIVDGSYGLRIKDVAHPQQRLESVEA